jgi:ABC-2 type transport system permease protein
MLRLVRVELNRLRWRRAVQLLVPVALVIPLAILALWVLNTEPHNENAWEEAVARAEAEKRSPEFQMQLEDCISGSWGPEMTPQRCERELEPQPEWFLEHNEMRPREAVKDYGPGISFVLAGVLVLAAMTYAGADWSSGSISNPRRLQLFTAKLVAIGGLAAAVTLLTHAAWWLTFAVVAEVRDLTWNGAWTNDVLVLVLKSAAFSALVAMLAFALTMLLRHTVAALGALLAVLALSMMFIHGVGSGNAQFLSPGLNAGGVFLDDITWSSETWDAAKRQRVYEEHHIGPLQGFFYWGLAAAAVTAAGAVAFRRRDVP